MCVWGGFPPDSFLDFFVFCFVLEDSEDGGFFFRFFFFLLFFFFFFFSFFLFLHLCGKLCEGARMRV